jgi:hypothetical protein
MIEIIGVLLILGSVMGGGFLMFCAGLFLVAIS